jgi:DNA repair exonuclease SbcCD nuclease subunit
VSTPVLQSRKKIRLIHTSDLHLGDDQHRPQAAAALRAIVDAAPRLGGQVLLLVGDIFDHSRVADAVLTSFLEQMGRLTIPAILLPGNHDALDETSVYLREPFRHKPPNLHIFTRPDGEIIRFPELTLDLWGRAMTCHTPEFRPLAGMPASDTHSWLVALAHGHFHLDGDRERRSSPIHPWEVAQAPCDYLALGHWDRHVDVSQGRVKAVYSGAPLGPFHNNPTVAVTLVDLDPAQGVQTQQAPLAISAQPSG